MPKDKTGFQIGDKVISQETKEEGTVSRLSPEPSVIFVKWSRDNRQEMVTTKNLKKLD